MYLIQIQCLVAHIPAHNILMFSDKGLPSDAGTWAPSEIIGGHFFPAAEAWWIPEKRHIR